MTFCLSLGLPNSRQTSGHKDCKGLGGETAGVIAWSRDANPSLGEYGEPTTLFVGGGVPDMEWSGLVISHEDACLFCGTDERLRAHTDSLPLLHYVHHRLEG